MHFSKSSLCLALISLRVNAQPGSHWSHNFPEYSRGSSKSVVKNLYLIDNLSPNHVIAMSVDDDGMVSNGISTSTATGGNGAVFVQDDGVTPVPVDSLQSQHAVVREGNLLYIVNAGSDSITVLSIDPEDTTCLSVVASPYTLLGNFPVTLAVSSELDMVCVGTAGPKNGVECFTGANSGKLTRDGQGLRSFGVKENKLPLGNSDGISDLWFSSDLSRLYASVKGDGSTKSHGWMSVFLIDDGVVSTDEVRSVSDEVFVLFGGFDHPTNNDLIFVTDSLFGAVVYSIAEDGTAKITGKGLSSPAVPGTCWGQWSPVSEAAWVSSPASNTLLAFDVDSATLIAQTNITDANVGILDFVVPGKYLYGLAGGSANGTEAAIVVVDISKGTSSPTTVQYQKIGFGVNNYAHGLAY